jgi:hypothetical protein
LRRNTSAELPSDADPPIVQNFDPGSIPVVTIAVSGPGSQRDISEYVDKVLRRRLETVYGVGQVLVIGARPRQINVVIDNAKLASQGLTAAQVVSALQSQNIQIPGGKVEQGMRDLTLRTYGRYHSQLGFHPDRNLVPGVEISSGSLGHGLGMAVGMALGLRIRRSAPLATTTVSLPWTPALTLASRATSNCTGTFSPSMCIATRAPTSSTYAPTSA